MTHPLKHRQSRRARLLGSAVVALGMLAPFAASADSNDRLQFSVKGAVTPVSHNYRDGYRDKHRHGHRRDHRRDHRYDRVKRNGYDSRYFVRPYKPLNFKHWLRVERRLNAYTPNTRHLNRYELRQVLGHGYDRYLRDHRRWSKRSTRRAIRNDHRRDRWIARSGRHDRHHDRYCNDRNHDHRRYRRW